MIVDSTKLIELWNGREVVGHLKLKHGLYGASLRLVFAPSPLRQLYGVKYPEVTVPIITRVVSDNGVDYVVRRCLDVRKKSKRQRELLKTYKPWP